MPVAGSYSLHGGEFLCQQLDYLASKETLLLRCEDKYIELRDEAVA
jgi:hypothetical protein